MESPKLQFVINWKMWISGYRYLCIHSYLAWRSFSRNWLHSGKSGRLLATLPRFERYEPVSLTKATLASLIVGRHFHMESRASQGKGCRGDWKFILPECRPSSRRLDSRLNSFSSRLRPQITKSISCAVNVMTIEVLELLPFSFVDKRFLIKKGPKSR